MGLAVGGDESDDGFVKVSSDKGKTDHQSDGKTQPHDGLQSSQPENLPQQTKDRFHCFQIAQTSRTTSNVLCIVICAFRSDVRLLGLLFV